MTPTQIARRSDALYADGTCGMTRRVLCDMVAQRESDLEDARAENAKLREQGERLFDKTLELGTENAKLREDMEDLEGYDQMLRDRLRQETELQVKAEAENAKLRELVSWMYDRMDESCAVQHPYAPTPIRYDRLMQALARARELGVEVEV